MNQALHKSFDSFFKKNDKFLRSFSEFNPETPLLIVNGVEKFEVKSAFRDGYIFNVKCKIYKEGAKPRTSTLKFSAQHSSYIKLVDRFGLSLEAKELYRGVDVYDTHFSGQANLTTLRWQKTVDQNHIIACSDEGKDLIFNGALISGSPLMQMENIKIYRSHHKDSEFVLTYRVESPNLSRPVNRFKIIKDHSLLLSFTNKTDLINYLENLENYWDCKHVY